jgi:LysM domain
VKVTFDGESYFLDLTKITTSYPGQIVFEFVDPEVQPTDCVTTNKSLAFGFVDAGHISPKPEIPIESFSGDPSFFSSLAVLAYPTGPKVDGVCWEPTLAATALDWKIPDLRPNLKVKDSGEATGAQGTVKLDGSTPVTYQTHAGDTLGAIAKRFGMTVADLIYLNPIRPAAYAADKAYTDENLNLSKANR